MLEQIFKSQKTIQTLRSGLLGQYIDEFSNIFIEEGYCSKSMVSSFGIISKLTIWLQEHQIKLEDFNENQINAFILYRKSTTTHFLRRGDGKTIQKLIDFLRKKNCIPQGMRPVSKNKSIDECVQKYTLYLSEEKGLRQASIKRGGDIVHRFLFKLFGQKTLSFHELTRDSLLNYINDSYKQYSSKNTQLIASTLRSFTHFLVTNGQVKAEFTGYIPSISSYRAAHLPEFITRNQVSQLLSFCDQNKPSGCRNYAILLLLIRLGLRACEVLRLSLDDINWLQGNIQIQGKGQKLRVLPLPHEVGQAIATYLKNARPHCPDRQVFICSRAPYRALNNVSDISSIVRRALLSAGLSPQHKGAHLLRYTTATEALRCGATLFEVSDLLGHCSIDTTALYTKIDITRLEELAMPWPEINKGRRA